MSPDWRLLPAALALAACLTIFVAVGPESLPLVLLWLAASVLAGAVWARVPALDLALPLALLPICVLLTWEGGLFFVPSVIAMIVVGDHARRESRVA